MLRRLLSSNAGGSRAVEMGTVLDRYVPDGGMLKGWANFSASTLAIVQLRQQVSGWGVPAFKEEAAQIYADVGQALAAADEAALKRLTTPSCFANLIASVRERPKTQRHRWETASVAASVRQVRIGHHASFPDRKFAQVTCSIDANVIWSIFDKKGVCIGGLGSKDSPHAASDLWVFERCITQPVEPPKWRLKERLTSTTR